MAKLDELTIEVAAKLTVSDETANRCMALLEMWMHDNDDVATHALNWAIECLDKMDTIVPAEGGGEDG